jgi:hypothetical protein
MRYNNLAEHANLRTLFISLDLVLLDQETYLSILQRLLSRTLRRLTTFLQNVHFTQVRTIRNVACCFLYCYVLIYRLNGGSGSVVGWSTMLQAGRKRVRFSIRSLDLVLLDQETYLSILQRLLSRTLRRLTTFLQDDHFTQVRTIRKVACCFLYCYALIYRLNGSSGSVVGWSTMLQAGISRVRYSIRSLDF